MSREETEEQLEAAALELLRRDGVLAGLNLREVADNAGVNRGLVYHYFGSRQRLLRSALRKRSQQRLDELRAGRDLPFTARWLRFLRLIARQRETVSLMTLLVLDGSEIRTMPGREQTLRLLQADRDADQLAPDTDLEATHAAIVSLGWGYALYRRSLSREFGVPTDELDDRVASVFERMLRGLAPMAPRTEGDPSERSASPR
jgi:AcrR family transcriptional regulator